MWWVRLRDRVWIEYWRCERELGRTACRMAAGWTTEETKALIGCWGEANVQEQLDSVKRNRGIYEQIAAEICKLGYKKSWKQCIWSENVYNIYNMRRLRTVIGSVGEGDVLVHFTMKSTPYWGQELHPSHQLSSRVHLLKGVLPLLRMLLSLGITHFRKRRTRMESKVSEDITLLERQQNNSTVCWSNFVLWLHRWQWNLLTYWWG